MSAAHVAVDAGRLQGRAADGMIRFEDVPYARPPGGVWRWRPPQRPAPWNGVREAAGGRAGSSSTAEDGLTLSLSVPEDAAGQARGTAGLPVIVRVGEGEGPGDARLAREGVVWAAANVRSGRFGVFAHPALTAETPRSPFGTYLANYALMDQIAALQWVKRNIAAFGGDPNAVTIIGEGAGGLAVNRLMMIREAQGLFQRAIVQSSGGREQGRTLAEAEADGVAFAARLGVVGNDAAALRAIPASAIAAAGDADPFASPDPFAGEAPILDGRLLSENVMDAFGRGRVSRIPYMIGSHSPGIPDLRVDAVFGEPARALARDNAISGHPTWLYRVSARTEDATLAGSLAAYQIAFARTGDPNGGRDAAARPHWPAYDSKDLLMDFTGDCPVAKATPDAATLDALAERYRQPPPGR